MKLLDRLFNIAQVPVPKDDCAITEAINGARELQIEAKDRLVRAAVNQIGNHDIIQNTLAGALRAVESRKAR